MTVKEWLARPIKMRAIGVQELRPRLYCYDGYSISVQASEYHYCSPRLNGLQDYQSVELGFPSKEDINPEKSIEIVDMDSNVVHDLDVARRISKKLERIMSGIGC